MSTVCLFFRNYSYVECFLYCILNKKYHHSLFDKIVRTYKKSEHIRHYECVRIMRYRFLLPHPTNGIRLSVMHSCRWDIGTGNIICNTELVQQTFPHTRRRQLKPVRHECHTLLLYPLKTPLSCHRIYSLKVCEKCR